MKRTLWLVVTLGLLSSVAFAQAPANTFVAQGPFEVDTLDPVQAYDSASGQVIENVYEGLYGYQGDSVTEYEPRLATSFEESEDGLTFTFTLRQGVRFHSGNEFSCQDVEYSVQRALVTNPADSGGWILMEPLAGYYSNANDELGEDASDEDYAELWNTIEASVECIDDSTVRFNLVQADPAFFTKLLFYAAAVVDSQWAIENGMWDGSEATWRDWIGVDLREHFLQTNMSGTGAYRLVTWEPGQQLIAQRFDDYWGEAPAIETVVLQNIEDLSARILSLQQGDADTITIERSALGQVQGDPNITVYDAATDPELGWSSVVVNAVFMDQDLNPENNPNIGSGQLDGQGIPPDLFSDIDMRRCVNYAFEPQTYIEQVLQGQGQELTMALPPTYLGYDPEVPTYEHDMERAEEHCRAAWDGQVWEQGFEFTMAYNTGNLSRQTVAEIIKGNLEFLNPNFRVNVQGISWPDFLNQRQQGLLPISIVGWIPDYADPDNYVHTFYACDGYYASTSSFCDEELNALDQQARTSLDEAERVRLYSEIGQRAYELAPYVLLPSGVPFVVARSNLEGIYLNPMLSGGYLWKDLSKS